MVEMTSSSISMERSAMVGMVSWSMFGIVPGFSWSAPEQNPRPAPVMTTTRTPLSSPISRRASRKGIMTSKAMAFMRSGRLRVTTATWGCGRLTSVKDMRGIVDGSRPNATCVTLCRGRRVLGPMAEGTLLAGHPSQPGRSGVPVVDDSGARQEVVQGAAFALVDDAEERDPQGQQAQPEPERPDQGLPAADRSALLGHHLEPENGHAQRLAAERPLVSEVDELRDRQRHQGHDLVVAEVVRVPGHELDRGVDERHGDRIDAPRGADVGAEGDEAADG